MSAIAQLKAELIKYPVIDGKEAAPTFQAWGNSFPTGAAKVIVELVERVEAIERDLARPPAP
jgi:hypothetical protein